MEFKEIKNFLDTAFDDKYLPRFFTKNGLKFMNNQKKPTTLTKKKNRIKTSMLRSDLCDFSDAYIVVKGDITVTEPDNPKRNKSVALKSNAAFINSISKIKGVQNHNAEDLDVVMPMHNLIEYSKNYRKTTESLWNYYKDEPSNPLSSNSESFKYKTSITGNTCNAGGGEAGYNEDKVGKNETEVAIPLKHSSNF